MPKTDMERWFEIVGEIGYAFCRRPDKEKPPDYRACLAFFEAEARKACERMDAFAQELWLDASWLAELAARGT